MSDKIMPSGANSTGITNKPNLKKPGLSGLHNRLNQAAAKEATFAADAAAMPNRIGLMLDTSSSMSVGETPDKERIDLLNDAVDSFTAQCDWSTTAVAMTTFPRKSELELPLTNVMGLIITRARCYAAGGTPLLPAMQDTIKQPITRAIIISDGEAMDPSSCLAEAQKYAEAKTPIDCVHIGDAQGGEELLAQIAKITGGIYIKFTNVESFAKMFSYLTPAKRSLMLSGAVNALDIGASEVRL